MTQVHVQSGLGQEFTQGLGLKGPGVLRRRKEARAVQVSDQVDRAQLGMIEKWAATKARELGRTEKKVDLI